MFRYLILSMLFLATGVNAVRIGSDYKIYGDKMLVHRKQGVPHEINYQGWLGTADDTTGVTGTFTMVFKIYDAETDGNNLWSETHEVQVSHGVFNVILGSSNPIPAEIFTGDALWLEVSVAGEVLSPRQKLVSVGYAIHAESAQSADVAGHAIYADSAGYVEYVDSAGVAANAWRWNNHAWGEKYPEAEYADTATYADTASYALDADVNYVDSAGVAVNAWRWNNNMWGVEYPKANIADTANYVAGTNVAGEVSQANYADTAGYALDADVNYVDSAGVAANAWRWNGNTWGAEYPKANRADTATYADTADYAYVSAPDNDWVLETSPANYLRTYGYYGIARKGAVLYGDSAYTHVNLGVACTTGTDGINRYYCTVSGGLYNTASGSYATVGGGHDNTASGSYATVGGGEYNTVSNWYATVGGGYHNTASDWRATVGGGFDNTASGYAATVGGGHDNTASGYIATVGGGDDNTASGSFATVGGGKYNIASDLYTTVGGGYRDTASGYAATVGGGQDNTASDSAATVGGGKYNIASGRYATVGGGQSNTASNYYATVGGGWRNTASGSYSTIPGGTYVKVTGAGSFAFGVGSSSDTIKVTGNYLVVFGDGGAHNYKFGINREDPQHPLQVGTDASNGNGAYLSAGGTWANASSRELKEDFAQLDGEEVLDKLKSLLVCMWRYKGTNEYHIGPMAEDFYKIFGTGTDDKHLSSSDVSGVALIAIKELIRKIETQQEEIKLLENRVAELEQLLKDGK